MNNSAKPASYDSYFFQLQQQVVRGVPVNVGSKDIRMHGAILYPLGDIVHLSHS